MQLSWSEQDRLAEALWAAYPEQDRLALDGESLRRLVVALPGFSDVPQPPDVRVLDKILWAWMRVADARLGMTPRSAAFGDAAAEKTECSSPVCFADEAELRAGKAAGGGRTDCGS